jgi:hypothetical protein
LHFACLMLRTISPLGDVADGQFALCLHPGSGESFTFQFG